MNIRYNKTVGIIYIVVGIIFACMYFPITLNGGRGSTLLTVGFVGIMFGVLFLTRTYFVLNEDSLVINAILGPAKTIYKLQSFKDIEIENNVIYINQGGDRKKITISTWMVDKKEWQAFLEKVKKTQ